ncbi:DNA-binding domain-containing protein [Paraburkholderia sp. C35]|uniref:HvfC/BufC N-terminal domain-containing protein n=1 Tax=Paraburkholderia sp. C35 TaxID=2126993 RepID=UPI000D68F353|nr:DNA-binding domain-containing protein [Paraburkholderia sp. C35]
MKTSLADIQQAFFNAVRPPHDDAALSDRLSTSGDIVSERLNVYRRNVQSAWLAALKNAYPVLLALTGDRYFAGLAQAYAKDHPSVSGDLNRFGAHLPEFIEAWEQNAHYDYFGDIARLEWAVHNAWYAAAPHVTSAQQWQEAGSERLLNSRLTVHPACSTIRSRHSIGAIWRAHQPGGGATRDIAAAACVLVARPQWRPVVVDQSLAAHEAFLALQQGQTLNEAIDVGLEIDSSFDIAAQLQMWISIAAVTGIAGA